MKTKFKLYKVQVGVLLTKDDEEYQDYLSMKQWNGKRAYCDENEAFFTNKKHALRWLRNYVKNGVINTYGILSELIYDQNEIGYTDEDTKRILKEIRESGIFEDWVGVFDSDLYDTKFVTYTLYKKSEGKFDKIVF